LHNTSMRVGRHRALEGVQQLLYWNGLFHHQGDVARGAGELRNLFIDWHVALL
jgi:hypothetical protein